MIEILVLRDLRGGKEGKRVVRRDRRKRRVERARPMNVRNEKEPPKPWCRGFFIVWMLRRTVVKSVRPMIWIVVERRGDGILEAGIIALDLNV